MDETELYILTKKLPNNILRSRFRVQARESISIIRSCEKDINYLCSLIVLWLKIFAAVFETKLT